MGGTCGQTLCTWHHHRITNFLKYFIFTVQRFKSSFRYLLEIWILYEVLTLRKTWPRMNFKMNLRQRSDDPYDENLQFLWESNWHLLLKLSRNLKFSCSCIWRENSFERKRPIRNSCQTIEDRGVGYRRQSRCKVY